MATVIYPGDHYLTLDFQGREVRANKLQLAFARNAIRLHLAGIRMKSSPVKFLNHTFGTRQTAKYWQQYLDQVLAA